MQEQLPTTTSSFIITASNCIERIHGGWGVGEKNEEGERVTDFAMAFDLSINRFCDGI